jgi:hypothetical protein
VELRAKQEEKKRTTSFERGTNTTTNNNQALTLSLSSLLNPSVFSCFSPMCERGGGSIDEGD